MPELCATVDGETLCMPVDLTVFDDPRQGAVDEPPGDPPGRIDITGVPAIRTRVARGAVPEGWPRGERIRGELVKGRERVPCDVVVRAAAGDRSGVRAGDRPGDRPGDRAGDPAGADGAVEVTLLGEEVFRAVMGRAG